MDLYTAIIQNKEIFKIFYALFVMLICFLIVLRSHKIFKISLYEGIRYFRNAFLFYGAAFFSRYILKFAVSESLASFLFEFFVVMGGLFLLYSLIWKKFKFSHSSLINLKILVLYMFSVIIALIDLIMHDLYLLFASQIVIFFTASIVSYKNYLRNGRKQKFPGFYVLAMILSLLVWILNTLAVVFFSSNQAIIVNTYILNMLFFLIFLYGIVKVSRG